ncbi:hypothetical protein GFL80_14970 [Rhizobium leguminosarum bv. viciae]|uniref:hypothetical protein n=1 Tax=Rhizobium leguminosarum TaxID=384 RepID=UPI0014420BAC|nr:hypothetical protein [Rhizobium leguminosarum]NKK85538.1 hypothetical protein [Rhizobium leguminosarum bv. viciae]
MKAAHAQADALEIEARAKRMLADEYDAAQERGEVATKGKPVNVPDGNVKATAADFGLSRKDVHEARLIRDAEAADPGVIRRALEAVGLGRVANMASLIASPVTAVPRSIHDLSG